MERAKATERGWSTSEGRAQSGVSAEMIRHYEAIGAAALRWRAGGQAAAGHGLSDVHQRRRVHTAGAHLGFSIEDIRHLVGLCA